VPMGFQHHDDDWHMMQWRRVFETDADGDVAAMHFNNDDRLPLTLPPVTASSAAAMARTSAAASTNGAASPARGGPSPQAQLLEAVRSLISCMRMPDHEVWMPLSPGTVLIFDNTRVMHGRNSFDGRSGRVLAGCYINKEDWHSNLRVAAHRLGLYTPPVLM